VSADAELAGFRRQAVALRAQAVAVVASVDALIASLPAPEPASAPQPPRARYLGDDEDNQQPGAG
jgi:hypothetical protein